MADVHSPEIRRKNMRAIKARDTSPEIKLRKALHHRGIRYRICPAELPGKPDLYLPKYNAVIQVNGCFWHAHNCELFKTPTTRKAFWIKKLSQNIERDRKNIEHLHNKRLRVIVVWECAMKGKNRLPDDLLVTLAIAWLKSGSLTGVISNKGLEYHQSIEPLLTDTYKLDQQ
ncbi:very short patch repair endonuclease [Vibrio vulnificus]|uniref:very short patch repair endonuclease n=1 Tax=Vibrio vulnificus TaxID=672 RepID=UPI0010299C70|nr:very short patch repair endonuclease [Vibrio vulnificus]RZR34791.1 DNA mismatch endonuclease Vsr [Vibrio vulnificus]HAS8506282.1 DNA mismatch endonuclease Vsr [Vibrio vulnificus]